jgi:hypothetical protein
MKNKLKMTIGAGVLSLVAVIFSGCTDKESSQNNLDNEAATPSGVEAKLQNTIDDEYIIDEGDFVQPNNLIQGIEQGELSDAEKAGLIQMREEEKLAHDVYTTLYEKWGQNIFNNISDSEQTHTDSIKTLLNNYKIDDPVENSAIGEFNYPGMKELYNNLTEKGLESLTNALAVGAMVEDLDIKDLQELLKITDNEDIRIVYQNLVKGSRNHMRAFVGQMERNGGSYSAQHITEQEYQEIINTDQERGSINSGGSGLSDGSSKRNSNRR